MTDFKSQSIMKAFRIFSLLGIGAILLTYSSCKDKGGTVETDSDKQLGKLSKTWKVNSVSLDGTDKTTDYSSFQLTITGTKGNTSFGYSTTGRPSLSPWKSSGTWEFGTDVFSQIIRDKGTADELAITYAVTETTLQITFTFNGDGYTGRTDVVKGLWVFNFKL
jgi:hypothetical protein